MLKIVTGHGDHVLTGPVFELKPANSDVVTMSSLEIAELTGKRPADVMRDIRSMLESLGEGGELRFESSYVSEQNKSLPCVNLPRREVNILLTGYRVPLRAKVIDRWRELEEQSAKSVVPALPNFSNPAEAARAWASEFDKTCPPFKMVRGKGLIFTPEQIESHGRERMSAD